MYLWTERKRETKTSNKIQTEMIGNSLVLSDRLASFVIIRDDYSSFGTHPLGDTPRIYHQPVDGFGSSTY